MPSQYPTVLYSHFNNTISEGDFANNSQYLLRENLEPGDIFSYYDTQDRSELRIVLPQRKCDNGVNIFPQDMALTDTPTIKLGAKLIADMKQRVYVFNVTSVEVSPFQKYQ